MNFKKFMMSSLLVLSSTLHAQDNIGWGDVPGAPGQPSFPTQPARPSKPGRPERPTQPTQPSQPTRPTQPSQPSFPGGADDPWGNAPIEHQDPWEEQERIRNVELKIGQFYQGNSRLNLLQDAYTRAQLQGKKIKKVILVLSSEQGNGVARLLINGSALDNGQVIARKTERYTFKLDAFSNSIDRGLRSLELEMSRGRFYVEKAVFSFVQDDGPAYPGPGIPSQPQFEVVRQQLNEVIQGEGGLQLYRLFNLGAERQGQALRRVTVVARSDRGGAFGQLLVNDINSANSQSIGYGSSRISFEVNGLRIGREIQGLRLYFKGQVVIEEVSLEFERAGAGSGSGPIQERRIEQVVNQRLYETNGVSLVELMRLDRRHESRTVESVELYLRSSDYGARVKLCQQVQGSYSTLNCGNISTLSQGAQLVRLTSVNFAKLSELSLSVKMGMIDIDRIIINLR